MSSYVEFTPYIISLGAFLDQYLSNRDLKVLFVKKGGIELVLDLLQSPSLTDDFVESSAGKSLGRVVVQLVEHSPILVWPSLLRRTMAAVEDLKPLVDCNPAGPYFERFLRPSDPGSDAQLSQSEIEEATSVVKALLNVQVLLKATSDCIPANRSTTISLHPVNVYDYYISLTTGLGEVLRVVLAEEMKITNVVPKHWSSRKTALALRDRVSGDPSATGIPPTIAGFAAAAAADGDDSSLQDEFLPAALLSRPGDEPAARQTKKPTQQEQSSFAFRNFHTLRALLHSFMPTTFPFFQYLGRVLLPRRLRDPYQRSRQLHIADALAATILDQLFAEDNPSMLEYHSGIVMLHTLHEMLVDHLRQANAPSTHIILPVLLAFKDRGGIDALNKMLRIFAKVIARSPQDSQEQTKSRLAALGMKKILELYALIVNGRNIMDGATMVELTPRTPDRQGPQIGLQLLIELRGAILQVARELWESTLVEQISTPMVSKLVEVLGAIAQADEEGTAHQRGDKGNQSAVFPRERIPFNWASTKVLFSYLVDTIKCSETLAQEAIYRAQGLQEPAVDYCAAHKAGVAGLRTRYRQKMPST